MKNTEQLTAIISDLQQGKEDAAAALYEACRDDVYYFIFKTVNDAELAADLTQDTFIEILQTIGNLQEPAAFPAWSRQIAYHKCTAHFRKRHDVLVDENQDGQTVFDTLVEERGEFIPGEALEKRDLRQIIHRMINELPEEQRTALMMRYFEELSVKQIAQVQSVSEGTVKSRLNYGRQALKQAVKDYEKKNGIKLHCAGIIPLLLWLFKISGGFNSTAAAGTIAKEGLKAAGKVTAKKIIAGVTAAAVVAGGVTAGVLLTREPEEKEREKPLMEWYGYGDTGGFSERRFELSIEKMSNRYIRGHLEVSSLYEIIYETDFEGDGELSDGTVVYEIDLKTPAVIPYIGTEYSETQLIYNKKDDQFTFDGWIDTIMNRAQRKPSKLLVRNEVWSGYGEDSFYDVLDEKPHLFTLEIDELREEEVKGTLTVSCNGQTDHVSDFTGRGFMENDEIHYEILLETPRTRNYIVEYTVDRFWLTYDTQTEVFSTSALETYAFELEKND